MKIKDLLGRYTIGFNHNGVCPSCGENFNKKREAQICCSRECAGILRMKNRPLGLKYKIRKDKGTKRPYLIIDSGACRIRAFRQWANHEYREKQTISHAKRIGTMASNWRGGISQQSPLFRNSGEYKRWKKEIFKRDGRRCCWCGSSKEPLHVDHIQPFSKYPDLRISLENGRVLCWECHKKTATYGCCKKDFNEKNYQTV